MSDLVKTEKFTLTPSSFTEAIQFAETLSRSDIVPKDFKGNAGNILVAIQWGLELGLQPMQAMQNIAVINGRPSLWGDSVIALVKGSPLCEYIYETVDNGVATCRVKRKGEEEQVNDINNGKDINLTDKQYQVNLTPSSIKSLTVKQQTLKTNAKEQQDLFSSNQLFNTQAKVFGVKTGTEDFMRLQNETNEAIRLESEKQGRKLTSQEKERVINDQFVTGTIKNSGYFWDDKKMRFQVDKKDRSNFVVEKESNIPDSIKKELTKRLEAGGVKPTPELLLGAYNAYLKGNN